MIEEIKSHFESSGFYVSDGLKYGVDLLLYTDLPSKVHSKYAVLIDRNQTIFEIISVQRVCGSVNKELIFLKEREGKFQYFRIQRSRNLDIKKDEI